MRLSFLPEQLVRSSQQLVLKDTKKGFYQVLDSDLVLQLLHTFYCCFWGENTLPLNLWDSVYSMLFTFQARRLSVERNSYGNVAGWLCVTLRYCIKTAEPIRKLFRPSESPITLVFSLPLRIYKIPRGTPSLGALNTRGVGKRRFLCDFRRTSPFISETVRDRPMVTMER